MIPNRGAALDGTVLVDWSSFNHNAPSPDQLRNLYREQGRIGFNQCLTLKLLIRRDWILALLKVRCFIFHANHINWILPRSTEASSDDCWREKQETQQ